MPYPPYPPEPESTRSEWLLTIIGVFLVTALALGGFILAIYLGGKLLGAIFGTP